jgi:hypothetical protein
VAFDLRANTSVVKNKLVTNFPQVPDAQISSFKLTIDGGRRGILVVTHRQNLCTGKQLAGVVLGGQSGKRVSNSTKLAATGCSKKAPTHRGASHGRAGRRWRGRPSWPLRRCIAFNG